MRIHKVSGKVTFVASGEKGGGCPTANVLEKKVRFRDDYYGKVKITKKLSLRLFA